MEVLNSHTKQMHMWCISVCLCRQMLRENGDSQAKGGVCAYPQIRTSIVKTVSRQLSVKEEQKTMWVWRLFEVAFAFLRRSRALLCCAATTEYCVSKPSRRRRGDVAGSRQLVNTTQKSSGPCALLEAHLRNCKSLKGEQKEFQCETALEECQGPY